jgi:hypothetical protein
MATAQRQLRWKFSLLEWLDYPQLLRSGLGTCFLLQFPQRFFQCFDLMFELREYFSGVG